MLKTSAVRSFIVDICSAKGTVDSNILTRLTDACDKCNGNLQSVVTEIDGILNKTAVDQPGTDIAAHAAEQETPVQAAAAVRKRCPACGEVYPVNYLFCIKCGQTLVEDTAVPAVKNEPESVAAENATQQQEAAEEQKSSVVNTETKDIMYFAGSVKTEAADSKPSEPVTEEKDETVTQPQPAVDKTGPVPDIAKAENEKSEGAPERRPFGETTLLGFTNGETSILGGIGSSFDIPNLVREITNEKIFIRKRSFILGKSSEQTDYAITNNNAISRVHAEISVVGNDYFIIDKGSTNHTYVNGELLTPNVSKQIFDGDKVKLANEIFTFCLH